MRIKRNNKLSLMNIFYKYRVVLAFVLPVIILILLRIFDTGSFKNDSGKWAEPSLRQSNLVTTGEVNKISGNRLVIILDSMVTGQPGRLADKIVIQPDSVLSSGNLKLIREHKGPVLFCSSDPALSAKIWMVFSQLGVKNIYILSDSADNELFKDKFRPDTNGQPEL